MDLCKGNKILLVELIEYSNIFKLKTLDLYTLPYSKFLRCLRYLDWMILRAFNIALKNIHKDCHKKNQDKFT